MPFDARWSRSRANESRVGSCAATAGSTTEIDSANHAAQLGAEPIYEGRLARLFDRLTDGLPGPGNYQSVYREGMDTDGLDPEGVYVGTSNGMTYASIDGGDRWSTLPGMLPPILSVACAAV